MSAKNVVLAMLAVILLAAGFLLLAREQNPQVIFPRFPKKIAVEVELAVQPEEWAQGLMFRESLGENKGMLFIFPGEQQRSFWMKNTLIPLDMIFINDELEVVEIKENIQPCKEELCPSYISQSSAKYVLEVNAGYAATHDIERGEKVQIRYR